MGDDIRILVSVDNSRCKKDVKNIKVRLEVSQRGIATRPKSKSTYKTTDIFDYRVRDTTVPKFESQEKTLVIKIPNENRIKPTFNGKLISVNYTLSVHVKHDAWNEWGRGKGVSLPINI